MNIIENNDVLVKTFNISFSWACLPYCARGCFILLIKLIILSSVVVAVNFLDIFSKQCSLHTYKSLTICIKIFSITK